MAPRPALIGLWAALLLAAGGCFAEQTLSLPPPDDDPPAQRTVTVPPGEFIEANFLVNGAGASVAATFASTGDFQWNLHQHDPDDFLQFDVVETGQGREATLEFTADDDGLFSYQWKNMSPGAGFRLTIELTLVGDVTLHSWN